MNAYGADYTLSIQPVLSTANAMKTYQPLAEYLSIETGNKIKIKTFSSFYNYWHMMLKNKESFDLVLDAAHFSGYRARNMGYKVLAKLPDTVSYSLVTREDDFIFDADELINARIATLPSPSLGSLRLEEIFPNPMRLPQYVWSANVNMAIEKLMSGNVVAAIIPTRLASTFEGLNIVMTTEPALHMALSVSPDIPLVDAQNIQKALMRASDTEKGREMLSALNVDEFNKSSNSDYIEYAALLRYVFGYTQAGSASVNN